MVKDRKTSIQSELSYEMPQVETDRRNCLGSLPSTIDDHFVNV